jgi:uncharacterized protein YndB with AHSA1/START domain
MTATTTAPVTKDIVLDEFFPHAPELIWKLLTTSELMARWMMKPTGFEPMVGKQFTYTTTPAGGWDGVIHCEVKEVQTNERLVYAWAGGHESNVGYGSPLNTVVTWTLTRVQGGTQLRVVHSGFILPMNDTAFTNMSGGWTKVISNLGNVAGELQ